MKILKDLAVTRRDISDWSHSLSWTRDGSLIIETSPELTLAQPIFRTDVDNTLKNMFQLKSIELPMGDNAFEFEQSGRNTLINSDPSSTIRICKTSNIMSWKACITSNANCLIYDNNNNLYNITPSEGSIESRSIHSICWHPEDKYICLGNEVGGLFFYEIAFNDGPQQNVIFNLKHTISLNSKSHDQWVTRIIWNDENHLVCSLSDNSLYIVRDYTSVTKIKEATRHQIFDMVLAKDSILITCPGEFCCYQIANQILLHHPLEDYDPYYIIPLLHTKEQNTQAILLSHNNGKRVMIGNGIQIETDSEISPIFAKKVKKWSTLYNELQKYDVNLNIFGVALSTDGYSVAILYNIERVSIKYTITSENKYNIILLPLYKTWNLSRAALGLSWYQTYQIYGKELPKNLCSSKNSRIDYHLSFSFKDFLFFIINHQLTMQMQFNNFINDSSDINFVSRGLYDFGVSKIEDFENELDIACLNGIAGSLGLELPHKPIKFTMKGEHISETFISNNRSSPECMTSEENHTWRVCALTFLPILTMHVKICPVTNKRIINISKDQYNEYGWFTRTILEVFSTESVYSGTPYLSP